MNDTLTTDITTLSPVMAHEKTLQRSKLGHRAALLSLFMLIPLLLSFFWLSRQSLRLDESQSLWQSSHSPGMILQIIGQDVHVPLYGLLLHFWQMSFGNEVLMARAFSFVFYLLTIPLVYLLGKKAYNPSIGLFGALLVSISPFLNWYGNEIRMYALFTFLTVLNQFFFVSIMKNWKLSHLKWHEKSEVVWTGFALTAILGTFVHYFFVFLLIAESAFFLLNRKLFPPTTLRNLGIVAVLLSAAIAPWFGFVLSLGSAGNTKPLLTSPTTVNLFNTFSQFLFGFQEDHLNSIILSLWPLSVLLVFLAVAKHRRMAAESGLFLLTVFLPIALAFVISIGFRPLFLTRYLIFTAPSLYLFLGWFLSLYSKKFSFALKTLLVIAMVATLAFEMVNANAPVKENYQQVGQYLNQNTTPEDVVVISAPFTIYPIEYYYRGPSQITTIPAWNRLEVGAIPVFDEQKMADQIKKLQMSHNNIFVVLSYDQGYEEKIYQYFEHNFHRLEKKNFSPGLHVYVYKLRYNETPIKQIISSQ